MSPGNTRKLAFSFFHLPLLFPAGLLGNESVNGGQKKQNSQEWSIQPTLGLNSHKTRVKQANLFNCSLLLVKSVNIEAPVTRVLLIQWMIEIVPGALGEGTRTFFRRPAAQRSDSATAGSASSADGTGRSAARHSTASAAAPGMVQSATRPPPLPVVPHGVADLRVQETVEQRHGEALEQTKWRRNLAEWAS